MELEDLKALVATLRALGVTRYETAAIKLELGAVPAAPHTVDLRRDGFSPKPQRNPALQQMLDRLDPSYSDPALFDIR